MMTSSAVSEQSQQLLRVIMVDDNPDDRLLVIRELRRQFEHVEVEQIPAPAEWKRALEHGHYDLLITDYDLRWTNGLIIFNQARERWPDLPVIMFTGTGSEEIAVEAMKAGLDDYIIKKPEHFGRLSASARVVLEKRQQQRALRAAEKELQIRNMAVESSITGICFFDMEGVITHANPAFRRMWDPSGRDDLVGMSIRQLSARPARIDDIMTQVRSHDAWQGGGYLRRRDGSEYPVIATAAIIRSEGKPVGVVATMVDISGEKRAEAEARENAARLRMAVHAGNVGLWDWDLLSGKSLFTLNWKPQLGYRESELGDTFEVWRERIHPEDRDSVWTDLDKCFADGAVEHFRSECRMVHKDGSVRWILINASVSRDADGRPVRFRGSQLDITYIKTTEEIVRSERDFSDAVLRGMPALLFCNDEHLRPLRWNTNVEKVTGYSGAELSRMTPLDFAAPDQRERIEQVVQRIFKEGQGSFEADIVTRDGRRIPYFFNVFLSMIGGRRCLIGIGLDISERKKAEAQLRELSVRLIRAQDEERRRIARELHDATSQNLATLNMNLALLEGALPEDAAQAARMVIECQDRTDLCAREIRTVSYLLHPPLLEEFGLGRACREYCSGLSRRSGIDIQLDLDEGLPRLDGDVELALFRILQEALANVYRHSGSKVAHVRLCREQDRVLLEIRDEGRGLRGDRIDAGHGRPGSGVGIAGMFERMRSIGGKLEIREGLPGVIVRASLPIPKRES